MHPTKPNILVILTDQQRFDTIAAAGSSFDTPTPGMDSLCGRGVTFDSAVCTSPICGPSRASIVTGLYPSQAGVFANLGNGCGPLDEGTVTVADRLQACGYRTVYHGKSHLGGNISNYGFENAFENSHDPSTLTEACRFYRNSDWIVDKRPFFHVVSFMNPHDIYFLDPDETAEPTLPRWANQDDTLEGKPWPQKIKHDPAAWTDERWEYYRRFYGSKLAKADAMIVELLDELTCSGFAPNTWVIFTADHGDMAGEHGLPFKGPYMYDGVVRVPLVIAPPQHRMLGAGKADHGGNCFAPFTTGALASGVDLVPTIMDIAGLDADSSLPGRSLLGVIEGRDTTDDDHAVFAEWHRFGKVTTPIRMIRTKKWKYNIYREIGEELYDLQTDPHELTNLADSPEHTDVKKGLRDRLVAFIEETNDPFFSLSASKEND